GRQNFVSAGSSRPFTSGSGEAPGKQRVIVCYNCKGEDCDEINSAKISLMANLSHYGSDNLAENSTLPALQDDLILSVIEQLKTQVVTCTKINQDNKHVNELLTAELEKYRNQERVLNELKHDEKASTSYESSQEIVSFKHTLSEHLKEKESLEQKITILKNDFQKEESRNIDRELALEKQELFTSFDQYLIDEVTEVQNVFKQMKLAVEQHCEEKHKFQNKMEHVLQENDRLLTQALSIEIVNVVVHDNAQEKDTVILQLKEKLRSLKGDVTERNVKREVEEIETLNIELDHKVDVALLVPKLRKNMTARTDYIRHTQDEVATLKEIIESERLFSPLNTSLDYAYSKATSSVLTSVSNVNSDLKCASCNGCLFFDNHDACVVDYIKSVNASRKSKSVKTPVVQIVLWYLDSGCSKHMTGDRSQLINFVHKFLGMVKFGNDHVAKIMGYGDYQIGNVTISRVYYVEGLGYNLFSVGQFCDSDLEVAFRQHTCFIRNLEGVDMLTGNRGNNLYTLSLQDMMASSPICLL
nr:retrovirus-related Pol polyprotein from transposon TNT 1-94 [Tanacetum cinerariifolium]